MPEGPEVEHNRRDLLDLVNKRLQKATLTPLALKYQRYQQQQDKLVLLQGKILERLERRGKFLIWWFECLPTLAHLGMTGVWTIEKPAQEPSNAMPSNYAKVVLDFEGGIRAVFDDMRNFGRFQVFSSEQDLLEKVPSVKTLGVNGLQEHFPHGQFEQLLSLPRNQTKPLGELLISSRLVAEIGNVYKSEILFLAKLDPTTTGQMLSSSEKRCLGQSVSTILRRAFEQKGATVANFQTSSDMGHSGDLHYVYGKEGKPCPTCKSAIERIIQNQRSTYYCPQCQVLK